MSDPIGLALLILGLPLAGCLVAAALARGPYRASANWPLIISCVAAAVLALVLLARVGEGPEHRLLSDPVTWFAAGKVKVNFMINVDPLSAIMLSMITFVSTWMAIFLSG